MHILLSYICPGIPHPETDVTVPKVRQFLKDMKQTFDADNGAWSETMLDNLEDNALAATVEAIQTAKNIFYECDRTGTTLNFYSMSPEQRSFFSLGEYYLMWSQGYDLKLAERMICPSENPN